MTDFHLGVVALGQGDYRRAVTLFEDVLAAARDMNDILLPTWCLHRLALVAYAEGNPGCLSEVYNRMQELNRMAQRVHHNWWDHLSTAAVLATVLNDSAAAARLLGAAAVEVHDVAFPPPEGEYYARFEEVARQRLGNDAFLAAWEAGRRMPRGELSA